MFNLKGDELLAYLQQANQVDDLDDIVEYLTSDKLKDFNSIEEIKAKKKFESFYQVKCFVLISPLVQEYNELAHAKWSVDIVLKRSSFDIDTAITYLKRRIAWIKLQIAQKQKKIKPYEELLKELNIENEWSHGVQEQLDQLQQQQEQEAKDIEEEIAKIKGPESILHHNDIPEEKFRKWAATPKDIDIMQKIIDYLPEFNKKTGNDYSSQKLNELCDDPNADSLDWNSAYRNVRFIPLMVEWNKIVEN